MPKTEDSCDVEIKTLLVDHHPSDGILYKHYVKDEPEANEEG